MENNYQYLRDIKLNDYGIKSELPVHVILDIIDYTKLREQGRIGIGLSGQPIARLAKLDWIIISLEKENKITDNSYIISLNISTWLPKTRLFRFPGN